MNDDREPAAPIPPRPSLTPEEQDALLTDLAAAYAVEYAQSEHTTGVAAQSMADPAALTPQQSVPTTGRGRADSPG